MYVDHNHMCLKSFNSYRMLFEIRMAEYVINSIFSHKYYKNA